MHIVYYYYYYYLKKKNIKFCGLSLRLYGAVKNDGIEKLIMGLMVMMITWHYDEVCYYSK